MKVTLRRLYFQGADKTEKSVVELYLPQGIGRAVDRARGFIRSLDSRGGEVLLSSAHLKKRLELGKTEG